MGILRSPTDDLPIALGAHALLGRGPRCTYPLTDRQVSLEHASLRWSGGRWELRDLGSRNGTFLDDQRLEPGRAAVVTAGQKVRLGGVSTFVVLDAGPPGPAAVRRRDGALRTSTSGMLPLPDEADMAAVVTEDGEGGWLVEIDGDTVPATPGMTLPLGDDAWELLVPPAESGRDVLTTWDSTAQAVLEAIELRFVVSGDEEQVDVGFSMGGVPTPLTARAHHFVLLALARARLEDRAAGVAPAEEGWRYADDLRRQLRMEPNVFALHLFRAREQLAQADVEGAARLFERRRLSGQVRLAVARVVVA